MKVERISRLPPLVLKVANENNPKKELAEMATILFNLRMATIKWEQVYGFESKNHKKAWEQKADKFIKQHIHIDNEK